MQDAAGDFEVYQYNASLNAFVGTRWAKSEPPPGWLMELPPTPHRAEPQLLQPRNSSRRWRRWALPQRPQTARLLPCSQPPNNRSRHSSHHRRTRDLLQCTDLFLGTERRILHCSGMSAFGAEQVPWR